MSRPRPTIIACVAKDYGLGNHGELLFPFSADMKFFRDTTSGHTVVMGSRTFESIGRPLPNRRNIILGQKPADAPANTEWCASEAELRALLSTIDDQIFIIGGASLYNMFIDEAETLLLTEVDATKPADTFFPAFNPRLFQIEILKSGKQEDFAWRIRQYQRLPLTK